jgi:hypothetical protein
MNANEHECDQRLITDLLAAGRHPPGDLPSAPNSLFLFAIFTVFALFAD